MGEVGQGGEREDVGQSGHEGGEGQGNISACWVGSLISAVKNPNVPRVSYWFTPPTYIYIHILSAFARTFLRSPAKLSKT